MIESRRQQYTYACVYGTDLKKLNEYDQSSGTPRTRRNASMTIFLAGGQSMTANICLELSNYFSVVLCICVRIGRGLSYIATDGY